MLLVIISGKLFSWSLFLVSLNISGLLFIVIRFFCKFCKFMVSGLGVWLKCCILKCKNGFVLVILFWEVFSCMILELCGIFVVVRFIYKEVW